MKVTQENTDYITDMDEIGYFKDANEYYNMIDASEKKSQLWEKIIEDTTMQDYIWADWATQFSGSDSGSFCQNSDEMKRNRLKITHRQGLVAQIRWVPEDGQSYTGFYSDGFEHGYIRFSQTLPLTDDSTGLLPAVAVKALRNGARSQNVLGMPSFHPTTSWNFFNADMANRVEPFDADDPDDAMLLDTIIEKLIAGDNQPFSTAVGNFAEFNINADSLD